MMINREILEQYLDGELPTGDVSLLEQALQSDAAAAGLLERLRRERALRVAAMRTYEPMAVETTALAGHWMEKFRDNELPVVGRIGPQRVWLRRAMATAAAVAIAAGSFWVGQATAPGKIVEKVVEKQPQMQTPQVAGGYIVNVVHDDGTTTSKEFRTLEEAKAYAAAQAGQPTESVALGVW